MKLFKTIAAFSIASIVLLTACSSGKSVTKPNDDEVELNTLCNYQTDAENYYANSVAESSDRQMAKDKAIAAARAELSSNLSIAVEQVIKRYRQDVNGNLNEKFEDRLVTITQATLVNSTVICDRMTRTNTGKYRSYITVHLSKKEVAEAIKNAIRQNTELQIDADSAEFDKYVDSILRSSGR